jgi:hypothetical protein
MPKGTDVGDELRLEQTMSVYLEWERKLDFEQCWLTLLMRLKERATEPGLARRKASQNWNNLVWSGDINTFNTGFKRAILLCERNHIPKPEYDAILKYLDLLPSDLALYLSDPLRVPASGWSMRELYKETKNFYDLRTVYGAQNDGDTEKPSE